MGVLGSHGRYLSRTAIIQVHVSERALKGLAWSPEPREERRDFHSPSKAASFQKSALTSSSPFFVPPSALGMHSTCLLVTWRASASLFYHTQSSTRQGVELSHLWVLSIAHHGLGTKGWWKRCVEWENEWTGSCAYNWPVPRECVCRWLSNISCKSDIT